MLIRLRLLFALLICCSYASLAQSVSIAGQLVDNNRQPIEFANIILRPTSLGTTTNARGEFSIDNIKPGSYTLEASFVGFETRHEDITLTEDVKNLKLVLKNQVELEELVITGTMKPTRLSESPVRIEVIKSEQINLFKPSAASSVIESIKLVNGVQEVTSCGVCFTNNISINGLNGAYTAVLMDGTPMYGNLASVYGLNGIPNMIVDRIEIIKGPSSTLYGSEAVAGVINIITKDPSTQPIFSIDLMGTTHWESFGNVAFAPKIGKTSGFIGLNYGYNNFFDDDNGDGFGDGVNMDRLSLFTKWNIHRKSNKVFDLSAKLYLEDRRNGVEEFMKNRAYRSLRGSDTIYGESIYTRRLETFGTYQFNVPFNLKLDFSASDHQQDSYYGSDHYTASQQIAFTNLVWSGKIRKHDLVSGATMRYQVYNDNTVATEVLNPDSTITDVTDKQFIPGVFVQDEFSISPRWTILGGMRFDYYSSHGLILSPRLSTKGKVGEWTTLRANFGTGFRVVNLFTEDHAFITGQRQVEILEELNPERSYNGTLSLNYVYSLFGGVGNLDIEAYYTYFTNKIIPNYDIPGKIIYENTDGFAQTSGIGFNVNHSFRVPLSIGIGVNLQRATESNRNQEGELETMNIEFAPNWSGVLTANYQLARLGLSIAYSANFTGNMTLPEVYDLDNNGSPVSEPRPTTSKPFSIHSLQVIKSINTRFSVYAGLENIFNYRQAASPLSGYNDPNFAAGFSPFFDTSYAYSPNHGVELFLGFKWTIDRAK